MIPLPPGLTREEVIDGLKEVRNMAVAAQHERDPAFTRWPDLDIMIEHIATHGFPPPESTTPV